MDPSKFEIEECLKAARQLEVRAGNLAARLEKLLQAAGPSNNISNGDPFKRSDNRMSDVGIAAINAAFDAGATVMDVARKFDITASAASNRRKIWMASKYEVKPLFNRSV